MERQVVELVRQGLTNAEVAERLFTSPETVKTLLSRAFAKLGVRSRRRLRAGPHPDA
jgi:DNA-binding CsgD family transcriptional regulator